MKTIDILKPPSSLWLGRRGEENARTYAFLWDRWHRDHPGATLSLIYTNPEGEQLIAATGTSSPIIWRPGLDATVPSGFGSLECHLLDGDDVIVISEPITTIIDDSASDAQQAAPAWVDQVVQDVTAQADRAEEAVAGIGDQVDEAVAEALPPAIEDYLDEHPITITESDPTVPAWAKTPQKPSYTAAEVGALPDTYTPPVASVNGKTGAVVLDAEDVGALPDDTPIPAAVTVDSALSPTSENPVQNKVVKAALDGKGTYSKPSGGIPASDLASAVQTSLGKADTALQSAPVSSVNSKTGAVTLTASDVGALPSSTSIPTKVSDLTNDSGFQTAAQVQSAIAAAAELPSVSASDNGKFVRVVNGAYAVQTVPAAESNSFGGGS